MNETVNLSQIITRLAKVTGADSNVCRHYIRELFGAVTELLAEGDSVEIKGIGTFMRSVEPSDDGEPRVLFRADQALAEEVNRPFSMFEAVELADGVDESDLAAATAIPDDVTVAVEAESEPQPEPEILPPPVEPEPRPEPVAVVAEPESEPTPEPIAEPEPQPEAAILPAEPIIEPIPEPEPVEVPEPEPAHTRAERPDNVVKPVQPRPRPSFPEDEEDGENNDAPLPVPPAGGRRRGWLWVVIIGLVAGIVIGLIAGLTVDVGVEPAPLPPVDGETADAQTEQAPAVSEPEAAAAETAVLPAATTPEPTPAPANPAPAPAAPEPVYETVSSTNYLSSMARRHYGAQVYWVYIYEANADHLGHPDRIAPGTRVVIPPRSSFPQASSEAEARRMAERKAAEIRARHAR